MVAPETRQEKSQEMDVELVETMGSPRAAPLRHRKLPFTLRQQSESLIDPTRRERSRSGSGVVFPFQSRTRTRRSRLGVSPGPIFFSLMDGVSSISQIADIPWPPSTSDPPSHRSGTFESLLRKLPWIAEHDRHDRNEMIPIELEAEKNRNVLDLEFIASTRSPEQVQLASSANGSPEGDDDEDLPVDANFYFFLIICEAPLALHSSCASTYLI